MQKHSVSAPATSASPRPLDWLRKNVFASPTSVLATVLVVWLALYTLPGLVQWALLKANFTASSGQECRQSGGACWAFIAEKHRLILFGTYPYDEQWRGLAATALLIGILIISGIRRFWKPWLAGAWVLCLCAVWVLMRGGYFGLSEVETDRWGGLPLTLIMATFGIGVGFPLGVLMALGRRSQLPVIRAICVVYIELIRGVPLITLLFMSSVMLPLFLPEGTTFDKLLRAEIAIILFAAAYIAETVRGGLQAIPKGQIEAAESLGLGYWATTFKVLLPQSLKIVIAPLVSIFIGLFKDTSLVVAVGIFDLTNSAKAALSDSTWRGFGVEAYLFIAAIYFFFCYAMSTYSKSLEAKTKQREAH
ncbi:amino acid ABC transporter permease [Comamonas sp. J-3]|uniref:amino acid ABC transporter permease n=1 Tax=Comamonas trifloxystrobinivorans TaxID=3350256 RepID=UPI0037285C70